MVGRRSRGEVERAPTTGAPGTLCKPGQGLSLGVAGVSTCCVVMGMCTCMRIRTVEIICVEFGYGYNGDHVSGVRVWVQ